MVRIVQQVKCEICDRSFQKITSTHLKKHNISLREYVENFPNANLVCDRLRVISSKIGMKNKGRKAWNKGLKASTEHKKKISESHWSKKPNDETVHIRSKLSVNGTKVMRMLNETGQAFRMPKGYHSEEHKKYMSNLMKNRNVTWSEKIKSSHWINKSPKEIQEVIDKIRQNGGYFNAKKGYFHSTKMKDSLFFLSSYEERRMKFLESCDNVISYTNKHKIWIPYELNGNKHKYNPDLLIQFFDGSYRIEEIKGVILESHREQVIEKEKACLDYASSLGWDYKMIFESDLETI